MATRIHNLNYWARAGKTAELAANVRSDLADGATVLVATPSGDVDGAAWLAEYERQSGDGIPIAVGDRVRVDYCNVSRLNGRIGTVIQVDVRDKVTPYLLIIDGECHGWWCRRVSRIGAEAPIGVGDFVQWDNPDGADGPVWVTGEVTEIGGGIVRILVAAVSPNWRHGGAPRVGRQTGLGYGWDGCTVTMHRIPRPMACDLCCIPGATIATGLCSHGKLYRNAVREQPASDAAPASTAVDDQIRRNIEQAKPLVEGLTPVECYARWRENRIAVECGAVPAHAMTADQIAAAKRIYADHDGFVLSVVLRRSIAKRAAARANPIRVDPEFASWE